MENLRKLRKDAKLTMKQLGEIIGVAESTISLYETGNREPDKETLFKLADLIAIPLRNRMLEKYRSLTFEKENYGKAIFRTISPKIYSEIYSNRPRIWGCGLKFLP